MRGLLSRLTGSRATTEGAAATTEGAAEAALTNTTATSAAVQLLQSYPRDQLREDLKTIGTICAMNECRWEAIANVTDVIREGNSDSEVIAALGENTIEIAAIPRNLASNLMYTSPGADQRLEALKTVVELLQKMQPLVSVAEDESTAMSLESYRQQK